MRESWASNKIILFLIITLLLIAWPYYTLISAGSMELVGTLALMWGPGIAAILTELITTRSIAGLGWRLGRPRYLWTSFLIPLCICIVVYGICWSIGLAPFAGSQLVAGVEEALGKHLSLPLAILATFVVIFPPSFLAALGEEIGWRGLLLPELAKRYPFTQAVLISAGIWSLYHYPLILFANYHSSAPLWYGLPVVTVALFGFSFAAAWLRLKSGTLWTAALLHGSHNFFIQNIFDRMTLNFGLAPYLTTEFGAGVAIAYVLIGFYYWRRRGEVEVPGAGVTLPLSANAPRAI